MTIRSLALSALPVLACVLPACSSANPSPSRVSTETVSVQGEGSAMLTRDTYSDTDVSGGSTYAYVVKAFEDQ